MAVEAQAANELEAEVGQEAAVEIPWRLFTVKEFERLVESGIFREDERVELIEGRIVQMNPIGDDHIWNVNRLAAIFFRGTDCMVSVQNPVRLGDRMLPQPDLAVLRPDAQQRRKSVPAEILLLIEVADSSLTYDRQVKAALYAAAEIPEFWIVDINGQRIEAYSEPSPAGYKTKRLFLRGDRLAPGFAPSLEIDVDAILGEPSSGE